MLSGEAGNWLGEYGAALADGSWRAWFAIVFVPLAFWVLITAVRAIAGEYIKRFWFQQVHPFEIERLQAKLNESIRVNAAETTELSKFRDAVGALLSENSRLQGEVIRLRLELSAIQKNANALDIVA
ncbi:hypothetical protein C8J33_11446 [Rhizobium sp. PP-CC-3G-465]|nr:hypothetical protein C8J33_11446 [Rhizobium sp. PP-CC-3G-465]